MSNNGSNLEHRGWLREMYGKNLIKFKGSYYVRGDSPDEGQGEPTKLDDGTPIRFVAWFMDDC